MTWAFFDSVISEEKKPQVTVQKFTFEQQLVALLILSEQETRCTDCWCISLKLAVAVTELWLEAW